MVRFGVYICLRIQTHCSRTHKETNIYKLHPAAIYDAFGGFRTSLPRKIGALHPQVPGTRLAVISKRAVSIGPGRLSSMDLAGRIAGGNVGDADGVATECVRGLVRRLASVRASPSLIV
jgi:hypothetical protein